MVNLKEAGPIGSENCPDSPSLVSEIIKQSSFHPEHSRAEENRTRQTLADHDDLGEFLETWQKALVDFEARLIKLANPNNETAIENGETNDQVSYSNDTTLEIRAKVNNSFKDSQPEENQASFSPEEIFDQFIQERTFNDRGQGYLNPTQINALRRCFNSSIEKLILAHANGGNLKSKKRTGDPTLGNGGHHGRHTRPYHSKDFYHS